MLLPLLHSTLATGVAGLNQCYLFARSQPLLHFSRARAARTSDVSSKETKACDMVLACQACSQVVFALLEVSVYMTGHTRGEGL